MGFDRNTSFPYRLFTKIGLREFQIFIAQKIEGYLLISDGCALVPLQAIFLFPLIPKSSRLGVFRNLPLTQALECNVDKTAGLALFIFYAERFSHVSPLLQRVTCPCALPSGKLRFPL